MSAKIDERAAEIVAEKVKEAEKGFAQRQQTRDKLLGDHCRALRGGEARSTSA